MYLEEFMFFIVISCLSKDLDLSLLSSSYTYFHDGTGTLLKIWNKIYILESS